MASGETKTKKKTYPELEGLYKLGKTIGSGGFAKVKLATHLLTGELVAIKIMNKAALSQDLPRVSLEIEALKTLNHPNICKLYQVIYSDDFVFLVMEYCSGGELFDHIVEKEKLSEGEARVFFNQIVHAVAFCHRQGFVHRDLKPENILLDFEQNLKIVDFGLCVRPSKGEQLETSCGSPNYAAPEIIRGDKYTGAQSDVWSLGVILYALICGNLPFEDNTLERLYQKIQRGYYEEPDWLSREVRSLLKQLLQVDPRRRISTERLCQHPWLTRGVSRHMDLAKNGVSLVHDLECLEMMTHFSHENQEKLWEELQTMQYNYNMATYQILMEIKRKKQTLPVLRRPLMTVHSASSAESSDAINDATFVVKGKTAGDCPPPRGGLLNGKRVRSPLAEEVDPIPRKRGIAVSPLAQSNRSIITKDGRDENKRAATPFGKRGGSLLRRQLRSPGLEERSNKPRKLNLDTDATPPASTAKATPQTDSARRRTPLSARKVLNGLERGLRFVMSPRRSFGLEQQYQPAHLTATQMVNVTSTNSSDPENVLASLQKALMERGIACTQKGFTLLGKLKRPGMSDQKACKLSFELEVCWISKSSRPIRRSKGESKAAAVVGIRRKRLKGDAWIYKTVCEEVLAVAAVS